jgi:hypothetical protein
MGPFFYDGSCLAGGSLQPWGLPKEWDLFYSNQGGEWNDYARNWTLAKASFKRLITELNIKVQLEAALLLASERTFACISQALCRAKVACLSAASPVILWM